MVGVELPVLAMEHMYLLTEPMPEVEAFNKETGREMVGVLDFKGEIYTRQERNGILLGTYEKACKPWSPVNTPWDFGHELLAARISTASRRRWNSASSISRASPMPASSRSSTAPSPSRRTATRWSARCRA
jgi:glycine/D-amino acid oxidase-like deaminating enzyme